MVEISGTTLYHNAIARIRQLEELNKVLAAEVDAQRLVVEAAAKVVKYQQRISDPFAWNAVDDLRLAQLAHESSKPK